MAEPDDNPYAAPSGPVDAPPVKQTQPISLINRIVSTAFITFATFLALALTAGLLIQALDPQIRASGEAIDLSGIAAYLIVISGLYGFGFWLRRPKKSEAFSPKP